MGMKLYMTDNSDLMEIARIYPESGNLVVEGTIMGAMPVKAILKPAEMRRAISLMSFRTKMAALKMLFLWSR
jgi:hypothetical protein